MNSTNFPSELTEQIKDEFVIVKNKIDKGFLDHQRIIYNYISQRNVRGMLLYLEMGQGKTLLASSIAEHFRLKGREVLFLSVKSLQENFVNGIKQYYKFLKHEPLSEEELKKILKEYNFVTMNASNMISKLNPSDYLDKQLENFNDINLDNKLIIVDEAHTLFNSISNGSKNANHFYNLVMKSTKLKILFLTGTPIVNEPFELAICFNMCRGRIFSNINKNKSYTLFPEIYENFKKYFIDSKTNKIKNKGKFQNRVFGLVSYYGEYYFSKIDKIQDELKKTIQKKNFPDRFPVEVMKVEMTIPQTVFYIAQREKEKLENKQGGAIFKEKNLVSTSYRIKSRQACNILFKDDNEFDAPKLTKIYNIINKLHNNQLGVIYSSFIQAGLVPMVTILEKHGYQIYTSNDSSSLKYALFTGSIEIDERNKILDIYNSKENSHGELISLLLISSTGTTGLNLRRVRHLHIIEPTWSYSTTQQIIGRAVRYNSHVDLPEDEQNVKIYQYISDYNSEYIKYEQTANNKNEKMEPTSDMTLLLRSIKNKELNDEFLTTVASAAIECNQFNQNLNFDCFSCVPNDKILYYEDIGLDINELKNNCIKPQTIEVEEIIYEDKPYYYDIQTKYIYEKYENGSYNRLNKALENKIQNSITT
jgi:superfamily II DNA or RNA helicase